MTQRTGSVYLDAPRPSRRTPQAPARRTTRGARTLIAGTLATIGIVALTLAATLGAAHTVVHDRETLVRAIDSSLDDPNVRAEIEHEIATAIHDDLFGAALSAQLGAYGIDIQAEAITLAPAVLDDPAFRTALADLVSDAHERVLLEPSDEPIDMTPLTGAVTDVITEELPQAALVLPENNVVFGLSADQLPDLTTPVDLLDRSLTALLLAGLALPLAAVVHPRRHRIMAWTGRWLLVMGAGAACLAVGLPYLGGRIAGYSVVEVSIRAITGRLLAPAAVAAVTGMTLAAVAAILQSRERARTADEGAAAAFGLDEPALPGVGAVSPQMQLAQRGLVDVDHPLTNI